jgi:hypothetical protein
MARKAKGLPVGQVPYGARPGEDVAHVLQVYTREGSYGAAARVLNAEGHVTRSGGRWTGTQVRRIMLRAQPATVTAQRGVRSRGRTITAGLVWCWCGGRMMSMGTHGRHAPTLVCARGRDMSADKHPRPIYVTEAALMPWLMAEVARLRVPAVVEREIAADDSERVRLTAKRERWIEQYADGVIDKATRDRHLSAVDGDLAALDVRREVIRVPAIDWSWDPGDLNVVLRAVFERIDLGRALLPVRAIWRVPEWRKP